MKTATLGTSTTHVLPANAHIHPEVVVTRGVLSRVRQPTLQVWFTNVG